MDNKLQYVDQRALDLTNNFIAVGYYVHHVDFRRVYSPRDEKHLDVRIRESRKFNGVVIESPLSRPSNYHARIYLVKGGIKNGKTAR